MTEMNEFLKLLHRDPAAFRRKILEAFVDARCCRVDAMKILGVANATFYRLMDRAPLVNFELLLLEQRARREGWHHYRLGGRPTHGRAKKLNEGR